MKPMITDIDQLTENVPIIQFMASLHMFKRSIEIMLSNDPVRIHAEFNRPESDEMFKRDVYLIF